MNRRNYDDKSKRKRSKSRSKSRERFRDRDNRNRESDAWDRNEYHRDGDFNRGNYERDRGDYNRGANSRYDRERDRERDRGFIEKDRTSKPPEVFTSSTLMIKGLPSHTTEPVLYTILAPYSPKDIRLITQRDGECKGFAFVEFVTLEHAQYFMLTFAGSTGNPSAPQLIIENRAVFLEYARDMDRRGFPTKMGGDNHTMDSSSTTSGGRLKSDWLCDKCSCHNFARRSECYRCSAPRGEHSISVSSSNTLADPYSDSVVGTDVPSVFLSVRGFNPLINEEQIIDIFRQFALVKTVVILRDPASNYSKGLAFVEFHSMEHAAYALQQSSGSLELDHHHLKVTYARETVMHQLLTQSIVPGSPLAVHPTQSSAAVMPYMQTWPAVLPLIGFEGTVFPMVPGLPHDGLSSVPTMPGVVIPIKTRSKWPPNFELQGSAYLFQPKSGYFFEPHTDFYYCPKSKLYYHAKDGLYFKYDPTAEPHFIPFEVPEPLEPYQPYAVETARGEASVETADLTSSSHRAPVKISLNSMSKGGVSSGIIGKDKVKLGGLSGVMIGKKIIKDLATWGARKQEGEEEAKEGGRAEEKKAKGGSRSCGEKKMKQKQDGEGGEMIQSQLGMEDASKAEEAVHLIQQQQQQTGMESEELDSGAFSKAKPTTKVAQDVTQSIEASSSIQPIHSTTAVTPATATVAKKISFICVLCRRQFGSKEMLSRHEKESKLHAENLLKSKANG